MKHDNTEEMVKKYFETANEEINTSELIDKLKPIISNKCKILSSKKENYVETVIFVLSCIGAFLTGVFVLFPEIIDYTDIIIQFFILGLVTIFILVAINLVITSLLPRYLDNKNINLRGKLL